MFLKKIALAGAVSLMGTSAFAACSYENTVPLKSLSAGFEAWKAVTDAMAECGNFQAELDQDLAHYVGRPSPIYEALRLTELSGGARIFLKREDLNHTGAHKVNNTIGQGLLAKMMGKNRVIAETGAGQHGVATATIAARFGMECIVYMGAEDIVRQAPNVYRMKLLGAKVVAVESGSKTLKDALNEAMRDWSANYDTAHYLLGTAAGPHPFPTIVREYHRMIGEETRAQILEKEGVTIVGKMEEYDYGKFGWILDGDGNKIELWEPIDKAFQ